MVLLQSGSWVDALPDIPESAISCRYLADEQQIVYAGGSRLVRFPWLSVVDESHDMTDFFTDLRISSSQDIMNEDVMSLYCHQRQRFPRGPIHITTRDGDEIELDDSFQEVFDSDSESDSEDASGSAIPLEFLHEPVEPVTPVVEPVTATVEPVTPVTATVEPVTPVVEAVAEIVTAVEAVVEPAPLPESPQSETPYELVDSQSKEYPSFPGLNYIK